MYTPPCKNKAQNQHSWVGIFNIHFKFQFHFWNYFYQPARSGESDFRQLKDGNSIVAKKWEETVIEEMFSNACPESEVV